MRDLLTHQFEELPLHSEGGWEAAPVNGEAEIWFDVSGEWGINAISLDAHKLIDNRWVRSSIKIERGTPLFSLVYGQLEAKVASEKIQERVDARIAELGFAPRPFNAFREHNTLNRAQQGI